jgi:AcrR family transcriptional regulator
MVKRRSAAAERTEPAANLISRRPTGDRILSTAAALFARRGYGETSLRELMSAAGVSTTAFYVRFASKEEVLDALVRQLLDDLQAAAAATLAAGGDVDTGFQRGVTAMTEVLLRHRVTVRLALTEASCSVKSRETLARAYGALAALLDARLSRLSGSRGASKSKGNIAGWALVGALAMQVQRWSVFGQLDDKGLAEALSKTARSLMPK